jgi:hypothetical protein
LPVFVLSFEYLHQKEILHNTEGLVYITDRPVIIDFHSRISGHRRVKTRMNDQS